jgi:3-oxoacyl-[acyl-carrier-protein] synthase-3
LGSRDQFVESLPGYTLSDGGAAMLLEPAAGGLGADADLGADGDRVARIEDIRFRADSTAWRVGTLPGGGSAHPHDPDAAFFRFDVGHLRAAFDAIGPGLFLEGLAELGLSWDDFALVCVHQVAVGHLETVARRCGVPSRLLEVTVAEHGNLASASLPLQLARGIETGRCGPGDRVALLGLAGGISLGMIVATL